MKRLIIGCFLRTTTRPALITKPKRREKRERKFRHISAPFLKIGSATLAANGIGAFFAIRASADMRGKRGVFHLLPWHGKFDRKYDGADKRERKRATQKGELDAKFGEKLSWKYLCYAREYPVCRATPTHILYGENDDLTPLETICEFANQIGATPTVMKDGEHRFGAAERMRRLDTALCLTAVGWSGLFYAESQRNLAREIKFYSQICRPGRFLYFSMIKYDT